MSKNMNVGINLGVQHRSGVIRTDGFSLLVHAPDQWKGREGVCTEDNGTPVEEIAEAAVAEPDRAKLAARFGTTTEHIKQALAYALLNGP